jgi:DNA topoisomerase IA
MGKNNQFNVEFLDIPCFEIYAADLEKEYDLCFIFEKPSVCFTVVEYLDPRFITVTEEYMVGKTKKTKRYLKIAIFNFRDKKCIGIGLTGHIFNTQFKKSRNLPESRYSWIRKVHNSVEIGEKVFEIISKYLLNSKDFIICTDDDEEGELIGYSLLKAVSLDPYKYRRIRTYTFRNKDLFIEKLDNPSSLNSGIVNATSCRHILDMLWGKNFSRLLGRSLKIMNRFVHISIGRVQTPTLRFIKDKRDEIKQFKTETQYYASVKCLQDHGIEIQTQKYRSFKSEQALDKYIKKYQFNKYYVKQIEIYKEIRLPYPLYNTDDVLYDIELELDIPVSEGYEILKSLYRGGIGEISYPRTSSTNLPPGNYDTILEELETKGWIDNISELKGRIQTSEGISEGEHPGLHPVSVPDRLTHKMALVYELIARRFVSTFADPLIRTKRRFLLFPIDDNEEIQFPEIEQTGFWFLDIVILMEKLEELWEDYSYFHIETTETIDLGYKKIIDPNKKPDINLVEEKEGLLFIKKYIYDTSPPDPYTEAELLREMIYEKIGTDATRPTTIQSIQKWNYCTKIKDSIYLTELGEKIVTAAIDSIERITSPDLTRDFEEQIQMITDGIQEPKNTIIEAYDTIKQILESMDFEKFKENIQFEKCPKCNSATGLVGYNNIISIKCQDKECKYYRPLG